MLFIVLIWVSIIGKSLNSRRKTSMFEYYEPCFIYIQIYMHIYMHMYIYIHINLPVNTIVRLPHPRSGDSQGHSLYILIYIGNI